MTKICVIGPADDRPVEAILTAAIKSGISCSFLDLDEFLLEGSLYFDAEEPNAARLAVGGITLELDQFSGIYCRIAPPIFEGISSSSFRKVGALLSGLQIVLLSVSKRVVNRPLAGWENSSKLTQLRLLNQAGFQVPVSLVTTRPSDLMAFRSKLPALVYKSASGQRSIAELLNDAAFLRTPTLVHCPVLFQEAIAGPDIRVHVVGTGVYCVRIVSDQVDYRYAASRGGNRHLSRFEHLPPELAKGCVEFAASRGLNMAGFDFKIAESGEYYCLEMNPSPAFTFFDGCLGGEISNAVVRLLADA